MFYSFQYGCNEQGRLVDMKELEMAREIYEEYEEEWLEFFFPKLKKQIAAIATPSIF